MCDTTPRVTPTDQRQKPTQLKFAKGLELHGWPELKKEEGQGILFHSVVECRALSILGMNTSRGPFLGDYGKSLSSW